MLSSINFEFYELQLRNSSICVHMQWLLLVTESNLSFVKLPYDLIIQPAVVECVHIVRLINTDIL
jgi:hypothetical protein